MEEKKMPKEEFRYYEMPVGRYDLALLGEKWITTYCTEIQHFHNYFEVGFCHYGSGIVYLGEGYQPYQKGTISLIPGNFPHGVHSAKGSTCFWEFLYIDLYGFIEKCYAKDPYAKAQTLQNILNVPVLIASEEYPMLSNVITAILEENREQREWDREAVNGYLYVFLQELIRLNDSTSAGHAPYSAYAEKIRPALLFIEEHYAEKLKISELAAICHISETYFRRIFAECIHLSPLEYINNIRIQKACRFLLKEDISMHTLAWKVGFSSVSTLERNFGKIVGESPKQWKLKQRSETGFVNYNIKALKGW
ncbi:MAG: AraC family transcriptional regulator [Lachnospiraceae bacterium]|nr:AraC family transcriptional regulator [Lachnospiraceae bacterium]